MLLQSKYLVFTVTGKVHVFKYLFHSEFVGYGNGGEGSGQFSTSSERIAIYLSFPNNVSGKASTICLYFFLR